MPKHTVCEWAFIALVMIFAGIASAQDKQVLLHPGDNGVVQYRIPVLVQTRTALVLFAEVRTNVNNDSTLGIVARRSVDEGVTWSAVYSVVSTTEARNPSPVYDPGTGRIHLAYAVNPSADSATAWRTTSDDDGITWSNPVEVTKPAGVGQYYYGPNPGLRLASGRLIVPTYRRATGSSTAYVGAEYSDDGGATWTASSVEQITANTDAIEPAITELPDGRLLMDCRHKGASNSRKQTLSSDGGATWSAVTTYTNVKCGECQGSLVRSGGHVGLLLPGGDASRSRLAFHPAKSNAFTPETRRDVHASWSGYSTMAVLSTGSILMVYEAGDDVHTGTNSATWAHDIRYEIMTGPFDALIDPNPHTDLLSGLRGLKLFLPSASDPRAYHRDYQGTFIADRRPGTKVSSVRDRGPTAARWTDAANVYLRIEEDPDLGACLRFRPDPFRASGATLFNATPVDFVHQTGRFSLYFRLKLNSWNSPENHVLLDNAKFCALPNGFYLSIDYNRRLHFQAIADSTSRGNWQFNGIGALDVGAVYDVLVACDGVGQPVKAWAKKRGAATVTEVGATFGGTVTTGTTSVAIGMGNRTPDVYSPFDGWIARAMIASEAWGQTEFDKLAK